MSMDSHLSSDDLYREGLAHFNRGEWQPAIAAFDELRAAGTSDAQIEHLLADARLKLQLEAAEAPIALAPPRTPLLRRLALPVLVALVVVGGFEMRPFFAAARRPAAVVRTAPTPVQPTATQEATAGPAPAVVAATAVPAPAPVAPAGAAGPGTLTIAPADGVAFVNTPANIEIIMDASGSMLTQIGGSGKRRWQVAQEALTSLMTSGAISDQSAVALRTYGRRWSGSCKDMELMQTLGPFNRQTLLADVGTIKPVPYARTPLAASIRAASQDLLAAEGGTTLIVVTDGDETCGGDPAAEAKRFVDGMPWRRVHVIGFAVDNPVDGPRLRQIAANGNGVYLEASNSVELAAALRQTIRVGYRVKTADGKDVAQGTVGDKPLRLDPGTYRLEIDANPPLEKEVTVSTGNTVQVRLRQESGNLLAEVQSTPQK